MCWTVKSNYLSNDTNFTHSYTQTNKKVNKQNTKIQKKMYTSKANLTHVGHTLLYGTNENKKITNKQTKTQNTLNKNNWESNKDGEMWVESLLKVKENKNRASNQCYVNLLQNKTKAMWQNDWNKVEREGEKECRLM